jgi:hypothetical protein
MTGARQVFKLSGYAAAGFGGDAGSILSQDKIDMRLQEQAQLDREYLAQARSVLSNEQLAAFGNFLAQQEEGLKVFLQRGARILAPK